MTLLTLFNPILPFPIAGGQGGGGWTSVPPPPGGHITAIAVATRYLPKATSIVKLNRGQSAQWHNTSPALVTYLGGIVVSNDAELDTNAVACKLTVDGKIVALNGVKGTTHIPNTAIPAQGPHKSGVWSVVATSTKLRVANTAVCRVGDATACLHNVTLGSTKLNSV